MGRARWVLLGVLAACGRGDAPPAARGGSGSGSGAAVAVPAPRTPRFYSDAELAAAGAALRERLAANAHRECARPVLAGTVEPGTHATALLALFEPGGELAGCLDRMGALAGADDVVERIDRADPPLLALERSCGDQLERAIVRAARAAPGCSPYQVGVQVPRDRPRVVVAAQLLDVHARLLAGRDPRAALRVAVAGLVALQALERGHVDPLTLAVATRGEALLLGAAWATTRAPVPAASLDALAATLDVLLASAPPFADAIEGERETVQLWAGLAPLQPAGWLPPGGWDDAHPRPGAPGVGRYTHDPRDDAGVMFAVADAQAAQRLAVCPRDGGLARCHAGLARIAEQSAERASTLTEDPKELTVRDRVVETIAVAEPGELHALAASRGEVVAQLAALRLHVEVLRFVAAQRRCPTVIELDAPPFRAIVHPAALGDPLGIERRGTTIRITPPAWVAPRLRPWDIECPR